LKMYLPIREPTEDELDELDIFEITSELPWLSASPLLPRRIAVSDVPISEWQERLGFVNEQVAKQTLLATTQLVRSVEAETRDDPRRHLKSRLPQLRPKRINELVYSDTLFPDIKSIEGHTAAQLFTGEDSQYIRVYPLKRKGHASQALEDFVREEGAPNELFTDNAGEEIGPEWTRICRRFCMDTETSEPHHPNQNKAERRIQDIKRLTRLMIWKARADIRYWNYAMVLAADCWNHTATRRIEWRTPHEKFRGDTPDISVFRFKFWQPIHYFDPTARFPQPTLLPGRFLGVAWSSGDAFTYYIKTERGDGARDTVLVRSVIRKRDSEELTSLQEYGHLPPNLQNGLAHAPTTPQADITEPSVATGAADTDTSGTTAVSEEPQQGGEPPIIGGLLPFAGEDGDSDEDREIPTLFEADRAFVDLDGDNNNPTRGRILGETQDGNYAI
ncbi:MAG: hypothetical protein ACRDL7_06820, partial [Gaiellaceae bacterium]